MSSSWTLPLKITNVIKLNTAPEKWHQAGVLDTAPEN